MNTIVKHSTDIQRHTQSIQSQVSGLPPQLSRLQLTASTIEQDVSCLDSQVTSVGNQMSVVVSGLSRSNSIASRTYDETIQLRSSQQDLTILTAAVLRKLIDPQCTFSKEEQSLVARLNVADKRQLEAQTFRKLVKSPSTLREACDICPFTSQRFVLRKRQSCSCQRTHVVNHSTPGKVSYRSEYYADHDRTCRFYYVGRRGTSSTIMLQLLPFLQKTVEFTFGVNYGAGAWSIAPPVRYYASVERSKSPLFRAFDDFIATWSTRVVHYRHKYTPESQRLVLGKVTSFRATTPFPATTSFHTIQSFPDPDIIFQFHLGMPELKEKLNLLARELGSKFVAHDASASDKDQHGNTMLHVCH
jgi:hypothetical protein